MKKATGEPKGVGVGIPLTKVIGTRNISIAAQARLQPLCVKTKASTVLIHYTDHSVSPALDAKMSAKLAVRMSKLHKQVTVLPAWRYKQESH